MPRDDFLHEKCRKPFALSMTTAGRDKTPPKYLPCKGARVVPPFSGFMVQTSKKS
jgi:hypothetical protein